MPNELSIPQNDMPRSDSLLDRFATQHAVDLRHLPDFECEGIRCVLRCTDALNADSVALSQQVLASDPTVGLVRQLLARCAEQVEGAITAFATASGSATEVLSRVVMESATTIGFILLEPRPRLAAYFRNHVNEVEQQVRKWRVAAAALPYDVRVLHTAACDRRSSANQHVRAFVDRLENELLASQAPTTWPTVAERFEALQDTITYRTVYVRLCSETHFDAEETLRYVMGQLGGDLLMKQMALETIGFTRLMLAIAVCHYLGMRKLPHTAAEDLLEVIMRRYERASTLLTSNL